MTNVPKVKRFGTIPAIQMATTEQMEDVPEEASQKRSQS
jgi:hypothetical protein